MSKFYLLEKEREMVCWRLTDRVIEGERDAENETVRKISRDG